MKISIEGLTWQVELVDAHSPELMVNNETCRGTTWCGHQCIYISNELTPECAIRVIRHEVTHAFIWSTQIHLPKAYDEEDICDFLAMWASQILATSDEIYATFYPEVLKNEQ